MKKIYLLLIFIFTINWAIGQTSTWTGTTSGTWLTATNWSPSGAPSGTTAEAFFNNNTNAGTNGINMNGISAGNSSIGAIHWGASATTSRTVNNSSTTVSGTFTLNGITLNSVANTIIRNNSSGNHIIANGSSQPLNIGLGNTTENVINIDGTGGLTISSIISGSGRNLTKGGSGSGVLELTGANTYSGTTTVNGGTLRLNRTGGGTLPATNNVVVNTGGTLRISTAQTLNNVTVNAGGTLIVDATLTVSGNCVIDGSFQINQGGWATGGTWSYGSTGTLIFNNSSGSYGVNADVWWPTTNGPVNVTVQNTGGITMNVARTVSGLFQTAAGVINGNNLTLNGTAQLNAGGFFTGSPTYGTTSLLRYNTGGTYGRGAEWSYVGIGTVGTNAGYPNDVQVSNNTTLNLPNGSNSDRACARDLIVDAGSNFYADFTGGSVKMFVGRNFSMSGNVSLGSASGGDLYVRGNFTRNAGIFNTNNRAVFFDGTSGNQTITGTTTFDFLLLDKSAGNLLLASPISLNQTLTLTNGKVVLGANDLSLLNAAPSSLSAGSATSYVVTNGAGALRRAIGTLYNGDYFFPVGNTSNRQLATVNFGSISANNTLAARFIAGASGNAGLPLTEGDNIARTASDGYWEINAASATGDTYTGTFVANGFTDITDFTKVHLLKRADAVSAWTLNGTHVTTTGSNALASLQRTGMSGFSQFAVGGESLISLPSVMLTFSGQKQGSVNKLNWTTVSEQNNRGFAVERSADGVNYAAIGFVNSLAVNGNSDASLTYSFTDANPTGSKQYYRLRQQDINGVSRLSNVIVIKGEKVNTLTIDGLYPNPVSSQLNVAVSSPVRGSVTLQVVDMTGRILSQLVKAIAEGSNTVSVNVAGLSNGSYILKVVNAETGAVSAKFSKQ